MEARFTLSHHQGTESCGFGKLASRVWQPTRLLPYGAANHSSQNKNAQAQPRVPKGLRHSASAPRTHPLRAWDAPGPLQTMIPIPLPSHVAVIMDGNRRWAGKRMLPVAMGHASGAKAIRGIVRACAERGIRFLTLFAFSTENWKRPADEVSSLMRLLMLYLQKEIADMNANRVRLRIIGDTAGLDLRVQALIAQAHKVTESNTGITLTIAVNYGGRWDILQAAKAWHATNPGLPLDAMDESGLQAHLCMAGLPDPDLLIRTGGESRISNFLLWQMAYTELFFSDTLWPDFKARELDMALASYARRDRRFGTSANPPDVQTRIVRSG